MAIFENFRERFAPQMQVLQKPALPQKSVLPQVTPLKQLTGIGSMLPMQTITLPGGQTVQIPQLNMEEINANLIAAGIVPQTPLPNIIPEVATPAPSLPVAPSVPVQTIFEREPPAPSLPVAPALINPAPVATLTEREIARNDLMNFERMPSVDVPVIKPASVLAPTVAAPVPMQPITLPNGITVKIPEIDVEEINASLAEYGIKPQPIAAPPVRTPAPSLPVAPALINPAPAPSLPVAPSVPVQTIFEREPPAVSTPAAPPVPMKPITLPGGQTVQIPDIDMEAVNASLAEYGIKPQTIAAPAPAPSLPVAPSAPVQTISLPGGQTVQIPQINMDEVNANLLASLSSPLPVTTPSPVAALPASPVENIDPFASGERMPSPFNFFQTTPVATTPAAAPAPVAPAVTAPVATPDLGEAKSQVMPDLVGAGGAGAAISEFFKDLIASKTVSTPTVASDPAPITTGYNDGNDAVTGDFNPYERVTGATNPVYTRPPAPTTPAALVEGTATSDVLDPSSITGGSLSLTPAVTPAVEQPLAPYTGAGQTESPNYIPTIQRNETGMDALTQQLLFGTDGQGGFIPGAMQAAEKTFFNADGTPRVVEEQRAGFTGDQTSGMDLARSNVGIQDPFLTGAESSFRQGVTDIGQGIERGRGFQQRGLQELQSGIGNLQGELGGVEGIARGAAGNFGTQLGGIAGRGVGATDRFGRRIGGVEGMARDAAGNFSTELGDIADLGMGSTDIFGRRLGGVEGMARGAAGSFGTQLGSIAGRGVGATDRFGRRIGDVEGMARGAADIFGTQLGGIAGRGIGSTDRFGTRIGESEGLLRGTTGGYDQGLTSQFYNPYEDRVVQQTIDDVFEAGEKQDMAQRARDIQTGGESAFGSRARLSAEERREALGRGLGEALGGIRSRGFSEAQQSGLGEFARQRQAERLASSGLAGLSGQRLGAQQNLSSQLAGLAGAQLGARQNLSNQLSGLAGSELGAQQALGNQLTGLAGAQLGAQQNLSNQLSGLASSELGAKQALGSQLSGLAGAQLGSQQALSNQLSGLASSELGAQQALGSQLAGLAGAQLGAQQNLGSTLSGLAGTRFGAAQTGAGALSNMGALETQYGQNLANAQFGLGSNLQNLGAARQQAGAFDVNQLLSSGGMQQAQNQAVLDAQRANQLTAQAAPLAQYQALSPFISMAPQGSFQTSTTFAPKPSPTMAGINVGLGALGAFGNMANQPRTS